MSKTKIALTILGLFPLAFALGSFWYATVLIVNVSHLNSSNTAVAGFVYMGVGILGLIGAGMLYASYKILAYMRNNN